MTKKNVHTVPSKGGSGWDNKVGGEVVSHHHKKETAVEKGRSIARANEAEHVIHDKGGKIQQSNSYGNDPNPPKDQR
ncbi:DUF2188 domain-containing protein [Myxococcus sp. AB036A]|uniref:DUF2188 domain-containing protein n=1 Tax=Myxococcus sp. AB036A TaxID=2562793 RepID=UPI0011464D72|nr:DUF2188 domain-containing protein [Myxococcus sp. AB036A]